MLYNIVMNVVLLFMLFSFFNLIRYMLKVRKLMKMHQDNLNIKGFTIVNGEVKPIEATENVFPPVQGMEGAATQQEVVNQNLVVDPTCGKKIEKSDAYRIIKNGKEYFFCCWECREKFLESFKKETQSAL